MYKKFEKKFKLVFASDIEKASGKVEDLVVWNYLEEYLIIY